MKILILKPSSLGDVVQSLPVLRLLKRHLPQSEIFWWIEASLAPLLSDDPDLAGIFQFHRNRWAAPSHWPRLVSTVRAIRRERFDWAIDLQGLARSGIFTWLANAGLSIGLDNAREGAREGARMYYDVLAPRSPPGAHAVDRYLGVLPPLGVPVHDDFQWLPERPRLAARVRQNWGFDGSRWVALLPGARWENKRWPVENFIELVRRLAPAADAKFVILGGGEDRGLGQTIAAALPDRCLDLTGRTSLLEMIECVRLCQLVITNDTGPMHVAAALRRPIVALFGPTDPRGTGPYGQAANVVQLTEPSCIPCMKDTCSYAEPLACLRRITPAAVCERALARLRSHNQPSPLPSRSASEGVTLV